MQVIDLSKNNSVLNNYIREIRDITIQADAMRFRRNMERIGEVIAIELSKSLKYKKIETQTPLAVAQVNILDEQLVIASILRAGLALHNGILAVFDRAENAFVSAYRKYLNDRQFDIHVEYISAPSLTDKTLVLADPMLATGGSMELSYKALLQKGTPAKYPVWAMLATWLSAKNSIDGNIGIFHHIATISRAYDRLAVKPFRQKRPVKAGYSD